MKLQTFQGKLLEVDGKLTADPNCCCLSCCCGTCIEVYITIEGMKSSLNFLGEERCPKCVELNDVFGPFRAYPREVQITFPPVGPGEFVCLYEFRPSINSFPQPVPDPESCFNGDKATLSGSFLCPFDETTAPSTELRIFVSGQFAFRLPNFGTIGPGIPFPCFGEVELGRNPDYVPAGCDISDATAKALIAPCFPPPPLPENQVVWGDTPIFWGSEPVLWGNTTSSLRKKAGMGPGDRLAQTFWFLPKCPECQMMQDKMNNWGDDCINHMDEILDHLQRQAKRRHIPFIRSAVELLVRRVISGRLRNTPPSSGSNSKDSSGPTS